MIQTYFDGFVAPSIFKLNISGPFNQAITIIFKVWVLYQLVFFWVVISVNYKLNIKWGFNFCLFYGFINVRNCIFYRLYKFWTNFCHWSSSIDTNCSFWVRLFNVCLHIFEKIERMINLPFYLCNLFVKVIPNLFKLSYKVFNFNIF